MIKQVCFNTLKNDIFGSTIINYTSLTVNHRKQRRSCLQAIKHRLNRWIWGKNKCILSRVHKTWSFYNIYFSIELKMGKTTVWCRQRETSKFFWQGLVQTLLTAQFLLLQNSVLVGYSSFFSITTLHLYIIAITTFRVPRGAFNDGIHLKEKGLSLLSFM